MFDLITVGDSVIDMYIPLTEAEVKEVSGERKLLLNFGDKIPVGDSITMVAGNAANSAVGASRLKLKTGSYINIGNDSDGGRIKEALKDEGVDIRYLVKDEKLPSNHNIILDFRGDRTILTHHQSWKYRLPELDRTKWVYLTSMSPSFADSNIISELTSYIERTNANLIYNPGTFQIKSGVKKTSKLLMLTSVFIVNLEEAKVILGLDEGDEVPVKKLLQGLLDLGPKKVVITNRDKGSFGFDGESFYQMEAFPAKLLEMTGAGDAFATGVCAGLFYNGSLPEAMRWGAANSASVVEQVGAQAGLLTYHQMQEKLRENSKIVAKEI